jgi:hypothetical protein
MRRLRANGMVVSQKTYLELDDVVPSWIEAVVANFFVIPQILSRGFGPRILVVYSLRQIVPLVHTN